jgi:hypothetical protein
VLALLDKTEPTQSQDKAWERTVYTRLARCERPAKPEDIMAQRRANGADMLDQPGTRKQLDEKRPKWQTRTAGVTNQAFNRPAAPLRAKPANPKNAKATQNLCWRTKLAEKTLAATRTSPKRDDASQ